ncbi:MAG: efflux RND transporter periplasmic adaptor subunit [Gammaproteobacteria bacterium]|jgi:Cu(I)/Ag(I) efflux system membrane fusion protein
MNKRIVFAALILLAVAVGVGIGHWLPSTGGGMDMSAAPDGREILYWRAPMDPNFRRDGPGKSPMGMDLVPVYAGDAASEDESLVTIDPRVVSNLGVRTAPVARGALSRRIETVGYVGYDEETLTQVNTRVDGWIEHLSVKAAGDPVERGQVLFELYSPTLVNAQQEHVAAMRSSNDALHEASLERLRALGMTPTEIDRLHEEQTVEQRISVFAEKNGVVAALGVREGVYVTPATNVMSIAELDRVWILAEVFEREAAWVAPGQRAEVRFDYLPEGRWTGTVDYVYPELDPETRTLQVRLKLDNASGTLRPNMFARVEIYANETAPVLHVPREAVIRGGTLNRVVLALGDGRFRAQAVDLGIEAGDRVEIRSGISEGDMIVTSGQFLIDSESNIDTALARMDPGVDMPMTQQGRPAERVTTMAVVREIDAAGRSLMLEHGPIEAWSWPTMTMAFDVDDDVSLEGLEPGQSIEIEIEARGTDYAVTRLVPHEQQP